MMLAGLSDYPVGAQRMQTGYNPNRVGRAARGNALACQDQTFTYHVGYGLWNRQCLVRTHRNASTAIVAGIRVEAQSIILVPPGVAWADIDTSLTIAARDLLMCTALCMDAQRRM